MKLPEAFIQTIQNLLGDEYPMFIEALNQESPVSIRINPFKTDNPPLSSSKEDKGWIFENYTKIPWCTNGFYLDSRPSFTFDPLFHAGCYYVQEASSMSLEQIIESYIHAPVCCLDLCAAPGGKSTHLSALLPEGSLLVSNEVIRSRANILVENIIKWGNPSTIVTNNDPSAIGKLNAFFDVILADVPCSGEGMFRKDPGAISEWSPGNVVLCAERQRRIIADVWPALKPGGFLIYSTCTYNTKENEENIQWIAENMGGEALSVNRFLPHRTKGEGFFIAVIRKNPETESARNYPADNRRSRLNENKDKGIKPPMEFKSWLKNPEDFFIVSDNGSYNAIPLIHKDKYNLLKNALKIIYAGISLGEVKGKDIIPAHALGLSPALRTDAFPLMELDLDTAIQFLRKEALFNLPDTCPKGYNIVTYQGHPLGFIKNIGNRANNLYPQEWRIRKMN